MEFVYAPLEIKQMGESEDGKFFEFEGFASTNDEDLVGDVVEPSAFRESIGRRMPKMLWQHNSREPIGVFVKADIIDDKGLFVRGRMPADDDFVRGRVRPQMEIGSIEAMSIGFITRDSEMRGNLRVITDLDLLEVSLVTFPANPAAIITGMKDFLNHIQPGKPRDFGIIPVADFGVKWEPMNNTESEEFYLQADAHQFKVAQIVDGEKRLVPRAVIHARCRVDAISAKGEIRELLNALYSRIGLEPPFDGDKSLPYSKREVENLGQGDLSHVLRSGNITKGAADFIAGLVIRDDSETADGRETEGGEEVTEAVTKMLENLKGVADTWNKQR